MTGVTLSKYVASTSASDSARVIKIDGIKVVEETGSSLMKQTNDDSKVFYLVPGVDIEKKAYVNYGRSESACYVFLKVKAPGNGESSIGWTRGAGDDSNLFYACTYNLADGTTEYGLSWKVDDKWTYLTSGGSQGDEYYVYYQVVEAGAGMGSGSNVNDGNIVANGGCINVSGQLTNSDMKKLSGLSLSFEATAVQYDGWAADTSKDPDANVKKAWNSVKSK